MVTKKKRLSLRYTFTLDDETVERLASLAEMGKVNKSAMLRQLIQRAFERDKRQKKSIDTV